MKQKKHKKPSVIKQVFSDFRSRLHDTGQASGEVRYEVRKEKAGFTVVVHRERGANQTLHFANRQELDAYLKSVSAA